VIENPIWKTSYRLVLDKKQQPYLQGWAIVENPTDEDWKDVRMALVSGRPISFQMDLYQPLYVPRPTVEPELFASLRPPTYTGAMEKRDQAKAAADDGLQRRLNLSEGMPAPTAAAPPPALGVTNGSTFEYAGRKAKLGDDRMDLQRG